MAVTTRKVDYYDAPALTAMTSLPDGAISSMLEGKRAIVTGGGKGIGKGISLRLAAAGAAVVIVGNENLTMAEETAAEIRSQGGKVAVIGADLSKPESPKKVVDFTLETFSGVDILVNNAAYQPNLDIDEYSGERFNMVMQINLYAYIRMITQCIPHLRECGEGRIINISSIHGKRPTDFDFGYAVSKGGIHMLTREAAAELWQYGITVNAILPGGTAIEFKSGDVSSFKGMRVERERKYNLNFPGMPSDTGNLCVYLASGLGRHINGCAIRTDGGCVLF